MSVQEVNTLSHQIEKCTENRNKENFSNRYVYLFERIRKCLQKHEHKKNAR